MCWKGHFCVGTGVTSGVQCIDLCRAWEKDAGGLGTAAGGKHMDSGVVSRAG